MVTVGLNMRAKLAAAAIFSGGQALNGCGNNVSCGVLMSLVAYALRVCGGGRWAAAQQQKKIFGWLAAHFYHHILHAPLRPLTFLSNISSSHSL